MLSFSNYIYKVIDTKLFYFTINATLLHLLIHKSKKQIINTNNNEMKNEMF